MARILRDSDMRIEDFWDMHAKVGNNKNVDDSVGDCIQGHAGSAEADNNAADDNITTLGSQEDAIDDSESDTTGADQIATTSARSPRLLFPGLEAQPGDFLLGFEGSPAWNRWSRFAVAEHLGTPSSMGEVNTPTQAADGTGETGETGETGTASTTNRAARLASLNDRLAALDRDTGVRSIPATSFASRMSFGEMQGGAVGQTATAAQPADQVAAHRASVRARPDGPDRNTTARLDRRARAAEAYSLYSQARDAATYSSNTADRPLDLHPGGPRMVTSDALIPPRDRTSFIVSSPITRILNVSITAAHTQIVTNTLTVDDTQSLPPARPQAPGSPPSYYPHAHITPDTPDWDRPRNWAPEPERQPGQPGVLPAYLRNDPALLPRPESRPRPDAPPARPGNATRAEREFDLRRAHHERERLAFGLIASVQNEPRFEEDTTAELQALLARILVQSALYIRALDFLESDSEEE
ncbi:hypothetical protein K490DRAFT_63497 [Saccharata proteae CBS 121410]|uniref:Uncharacterized protein n=1 Tax=Saccharata proteae CBS 121410 TaxID=1314787 RepID=A0A6A5YEF8_9PEZI|nr:hypothetical protein K490DRAFT_63497 [Saccharata proteae CBS 121410]